MIPVGTDALSRNTSNNHTKVIVAQYTVLSYIFVMVLTTLNVLDGVEVNTLSALGRVEVITLIMLAVSLLPGIIGFFRE